MDKNQQFRLDIERAMFADSYELLNVGDEEVILVVQQNTSPFSRGTAVLIGEAGRGPLSQDNLAPLASYLNKYGWVTMLVSAPTVGVETLAKTDEGEPPADDKINSVAGLRTIDPQAFEQQEQQLIARLQALKTKSEAYPGFFIVIGQGTTAAWLGKLYAEEKLEIPDALVVISPYWPQRNYNKLIAEQLAQTTMPVLDIYSPWDNEWSLMSQQQRLIAATKSLKLHYRQRQLIGQPYEPQQHRYISKEIYGWLSHMGW
jgi:hypothetical protein